MHSFDTTRGRGSNKKDSQQNLWSIESYEDTAAMWTLRLSKQGPETGKYASNDELSQVRQEAKRVRETLTKDGESAYLFFEKLSHPEGFGRDGSDLHSLHRFFNVDPLVVSWLAAVEKVQRVTSLHEPVRVRFQWCQFCGPRSRECQVQILPTYADAQNQVELYMCWSEVLPEDFGSYKIVYRPGDIYVGTLSEGWLLA